MIPQYKPEYLVEEEGTALKELVRSGSYLADYKKTEEFESRLAGMTKNTYCHIVNNGTIALSLALKAGMMPLKKRVIVPNLTMIATATAVEFVGYTPNFCDIEPDTLCLDVDKAIEMCENKIWGNEVGAIIYVTFNGRMNLEAIKRLKTYCTENHILLLKDDAQSLGSYSKESLSLQHPNYGHITTLSFSPHKIISCGQGGAILTNSLEFSNRIARLKDFGRLEGGADIHDYFGINSKFTEMQAVVGLCQYNRILERITAKKRIYRLYYEKLRDLMIAPSEETPWFVDLYLSTKSLRDGLISHLNANGIGSRAMYPMLTSQVIYKSMESYPIAKNFSETGLWLPSSFDLTETQINVICDTVKGYLQ